MASSADQRLQKILELEQIVNVQAAETFNAESRSEVAAAVAEQRKHGTLNSGGTYKVLVTINARKGEKIIRQRIESRRASILKAPGLATPERFTELIAALEHTIDLIMGSVRNQVSRTDAL